MSKNTVLKGAVILTLANIITRFTGFFYRIYMNNTIGAEGMGLYQLIIPVYSLCWSITSSGFTTTISKLTAQEKAKHEYGNMGRVLKQSLFICTIISILIGTALFFSADIFSTYIIKEPRTGLPLKIYDVITSFNFRIAKEVIGCGNKFLGEIINKEENNIYNTLIVSPPGKGKTTVLRDLIRRISNGIEEMKFNGKTCGVVDERGEIAATYKGLPQNDIGIRTDVIENVSKSQGIKMLIRSMAPEVIACDEIGSKEDIDAIRRGNDIRC